MSSLPRAIVFAAAAQGKGGPVGSGGVDEDLRELERAAQRGDPDARARLLAAWRRAGRVDDERVAFAASLGDPAARALLGAAAPPESESVPEWLESTRERPWALEVALLAGAVAARAALATFEGAHPEDRGPRRCVEVAEAFVACPCPAHAAPARAAGEWQERAHIERTRRSDGRLRNELRADHLAEGAALYAVLAVGLHDAPDRARLLVTLAVGGALAAARTPVRAALRRELSRALLGL